jgi:two-component system, NtrC family, sensor kinase
MNQEQPAVERRSVARRTVARPASLQSLVGFALVGALLVLAAANIALRATWHPIEDGVLWAAGPEGVFAKEIAPGTPAAALLKPGDLLQAIDGRPVDRVEDVYGVLDSARRGTSLRYTLLRLSSREIVDVRLQPVPLGNLPLYFILAAVGIFSILIGLSVRVRRPADPATLHFFLLCTAFFGVFTFSFSGRLDRLDWAFYWANEVSVLLLPPLFLHFTMAFPERRPRPGVLPRWLPLVYLPGVVLGTADGYVFARAASDPRVFIGTWVPLIDRLEYLYLAACLIGGFLVWVWALRRVETVTGRRQLRWIVSGVLFGGGPFVFGYALPYALGAQTSLAMSLLAVPLGLLPLAFASAIVRYRLMDVEVIIKRALVYAAAILAIGGIYTALFRLATVVFRDRNNEHTTIIAMLATLVVVLLARPVKSAIQTTFDRAFYRDRYDYRRAFVGFARDLNSDLDLARLSDRLVARVMETFGVDRMALMLAGESSQAFAAIRQLGLEEPAPALGRTSSLGVRLVSGQPIALDDPVHAGLLSPDEVDEWRRQELYYFVPCVSKEGCIAVLALGRRSDGEPLNSEDVSLLLAVAGQVATALENGRLYRQLRGQAEEVDRMREFSDSIIESLEAGLVVVDADTRVVRWNRALERLYGVGRDESIGRPLAELFDIGFISQLHAVRSHAPSTAGVYRLSLRPRGRDQRLLVNVTVVPLRSWHNGGTAIVGTVIILDDVTSRVQLEEQLQISEKMASIGILAAGVAHEVNTPLTGISSFTQMLLEGADPEDPKTKVLEKIERQTFRAAKIVNGLLNLARPGVGASAGERTPVDLNVVINDVLSLVDHQFRATRVQVRRELAAPAPVVTGFEFKLQQVFLNLFLNARDAMPKGGWLSVVTRAERGHVVVEVSDTGTGIPREHLSRIYDPFFTTKAIGQGTGLGLSITYGIVREHDGTIACDSTAGEGTRFTLTFPLAAAAAGAGRQQDRIAN